MKPLILGAGGWGTALAVHCAKLGMHPVVWGHDAAHVEQVVASKTNEAYLPGVELPGEINWTTSLNAAHEADVVLFVTPSSAIREVAGRLRETDIPDRTPLVNCSKGMERGTGLRITQIFKEIFVENPVAALSGPSHAEEVARGIPAAITLGALDAQLAEQLQQQLSSRTLRIYTSTDIAGVELGGALKNVYAIAAGVSDGLELGDNAKAALVTRSLAEMTRLGVELGGRPETFHGLSGLGDLIVTCFSRHSRNRGFGENIGRGHKFGDLLLGSRMVVEGVFAAQSAHEQAQRLGIECPVIEQVHAVLFEGRDPAEALQNLMMRAPKPEQPRG